MGRRRRSLPCSAAYRRLPPVDWLLETEVQNILAFLEAWANVQDYANANARRRHSHRKRPPLSLQLVLSFEYFSSIVKVPVRLNEIYDLID
jgi:hypothetical protein